MFFNIVSKSSFTEKEAIQIEKDFIKNVKLSFGYIDKQIAKDFNIHAVEFKYKIFNTMKKLYPNIFKDNAKNNIFVLSRQNIDSCIDFNIDIDIPTKNILVSVFDSITQIQLIEISFRYNKNTKKCERKKK